MTDRDDGPWDAPTEYDRAGAGDGEAIASTALPSSSFQRRSKPPSAPVYPIAEATPAPEMPGGPPIGAAPRTRPASDALAIVATGADASRVRRLCQQHALRVPVMASPDGVRDGRALVVLGDPSRPMPERTLHVIRPTVPDAQLVDLLRALVTRCTVVEPPAIPADADPKLGDIARRLTTLTDRGSIETIMLGAITALTDADRAYFLFHDPDSGALWSEARLRAGADDRSATAGIVGWVARTGHTVHASPAGDDPRWLPALDDPDEGEPQSRLLVQPIIGADRRVRAVLVAVRRWRRLELSDREIKALATFAALVGPTFEATALSPRQPGSVVTASKRPGTTPFRDAPALPVTVPGIRRARSSPALGPDPFDVERTRLDPPPDAAEPADATRVDDLARPRPSDDPPDDDAPDDYTRVDDAGPAERYSDSALPLPLPPITPARPTLPDLPVAPRNAPRPPPTDTVTVVAKKRPQTHPAPPSATSPPPPPTPDASIPSLARAAARPSTSPRLLGGPSRTRRGNTSLPLPVREPIELAVIADTVDTARVQRIAKDAGIELATYAELADAPATCQVVTVGGAWTDDRRIVYAARSTIADDQLADLLAALSTGRALESPPLLAAPVPMAEPHRMLVAANGARALATSTDLAAAEDVATATIRELLACDRAYCWFVDPDTGALWSEARRKAGTDDRRAVAGIAGFVARTGRAVRAAHASTDPRWLAPLDDPDGDPHSQLVVQPLVRADQRVHGVLIAARDARRPGFTDADAALLARFAAMAAPLLEQLELYALAQRLAGPAPSIALPAPAPARAEPTSTWLAIARGQHSLSRWFFLGLGVLIGTLATAVIALLA